MATASPATHDSTSRRGIPQGIEIVHAWRTGVLMVRQPSPAAQAASGLFAYLLAAPGSGQLCPITRAGAAIYLRGGVYHAED